MSLEGREIEIVQILLIMYFSISIIIWIVSHDVGYHVCWFATWGVLCHSSVTKILKLPRSATRARRVATGMGIEAVVDLHKQSICQTSYNFNVVPIIVLKPKNFYVLILLNNYWRNSASAHNCRVALRSVSNECQIYIFPTGRRKASIYIYY